MSAPRFAFRLATLVAVAASGLRVERDLPSTGSSRPRTPWRVRWLPGCTRVATGWPARRETATQATTRRPGRELGYRAGPAADGGRWSAPPCVRVAEPVPLCGCEEKGATRRRRPRLLLIQVPPRPRQLDLPEPPRWGGRRRGAGRKPVGARPRVPHRRRAKHNVRHPVHVTLRRHDGVASLRSSRVHPELRAALAASSRSAFRVIHYSIQLDHVHLIVEADEVAALGRGLQGLAIRCARAVNRSVGRRGAVWSDRYHARALGTPREVRAGIVYVLLNFRKHLRAAAGVDPCSSGPWFGGWVEPVGLAVAERPVVSPRTWLATVGWRRAGGSIDWHESPSSRRRVDHVRGAGTS